MGKGSYNLLWLFVIFVYVYTHISLEGKLGGIMVGEIKGPFHLINMREFEFSPALGRVLRVIRGLFAIQLIYIQMII